MQFSKSLPLSRLRSHNMTLISLIIVLVVLGILMYLINAFVPMDANIKKVLNIAVVVVLILWLIQSLGLLGPIGSIRIR